jgi:uncharacterized coiled-coil protein SlyX
MSSNTLEDRLENLEHKVAGDIDDLIDKANKLADKIDQINDKLDVLFETLQSGCPVVSTSQPCFKPPPQSLQEKSE